jgi:hypothetical protein
MADATDSKSVARKGVWVQVPPPAVSASVGAADVGVSDISPQKADDCCAISKAANTIPKTMPRDVPRLPSSSFQAIQVMVRA